MRIAAACDRRMMSPVVHAMRRNSNEPRTSRRLRIFGGRHDIEDRAIFRFGGEKRPTSDPVPSDPFHCHGVRRDHALD